MRVKIVDDTGTVHTVWNPCAVHTFRDDDGQGGTNVKVYRTRNDKHPRVFHNGFIWDISRHKRKPKPKPKG